MHETIAHALAQQEAAISSILTSSLPPQHPLPHRVAASPLYPSPPHPHLRVSALLGGDRGSFSPMGPAQDGDEGEDGGDDLASVAPTPALLSHSPGPYHRSYRNDQIATSAVASPQPLFPLQSEVRSHSVYHAGAQAGGSVGQGNRESSFLEHNRQLLSQTLQVVAHLGSPSNSMLLASAASAPPRLSPGDGEGCSVCVQTEPPPSFLMVKSDSPSPPLRGITVACQCNLLSVDECSTLISSIWRGHVTRLMFAPVFASFRRACCARLLQKVVRGHKGRRLFLYLHSLCFRRNVRIAARLLSAHCARALLISRMRSRASRKKARILASFARVAVATIAYRYLRGQRVSRNIAAYRASCAVALQAAFRSFVARRSTSDMFSAPPSPILVTDTVYIRRCIAASVLIKYCLYALERHDATLHLAAAARARVARATVVLRCAVRYFLRKFRVRLFPRKRSAAAVIQMAWFVSRARIAHRQAARMRICQILTRNIPVVCNSGWKEWSVYRLQWLKSKHALFARLHSSQTTIALAWKCSCSFRAFTALLRTQRRAAAASNISRNWQRHLALRLFELQRVRMRSFIEAHKRLQENGPIKHALLQEQRAIDSRRALTSATEVQSPKPQPVRRLAASKIYLACRLLLSKCALRRARAAQLAAKARVIQRAARRHWQRAKLDSVLAHVAKELALRRTHKAALRISSCTRGFIIRRGVLQSLAWKCRPALWPVLKHLVASIKAAIVFRCSLFNPTFRYGAATALALSLQCARRRRNDLQRYAAAHFLRLIKPVVPIFTRYLLCLSQQSRARLIISDYVQADAHTLFLHGRATVIQCAVRCREARKDAARERLTTEMVREHQRQSDACALIISCLRRAALRDVWCRTFGGVTLVLSQNRNAIRRRYSEALSRHWEKLREKERKAAERLEKRSRIWTVVSAAARRLIFSSAHAQTLVSVFALERHQKNCCILLGFRVLACAKRRAYRRSVVTYARLISFAVSALHRRAYVRAIKLTATGSAKDEVPMHAPTPPWLEISRLERQRTVDRLKRSEKWTEFFSRIAAQQPPPAALTQSVHETESGIESSSFHGLQSGSFHAPKQESIRPSTAAARSPECRLKLPPLPPPHPPHLL